MVKKELKMEIALPENVDAYLQNGFLFIKGPKGEVKRKLVIPKIEISIKGKKILMFSKKGTKKEYKLMCTYRAHFRNMIKGVTERHVYKLKVVSSHFPMQVNYRNNILEIRNFFGEKHPRTLEIPKGVKLRIEGQLIILEGIDKELLGMTASLIEKMTRRPEFDPRVFQDGIYIIEKDGKKVV